MEQTEGNSSEDGTTVSPTAGNLETPGSQGIAEEVAEGTVGTSDKEGPSDWAEHLCKAASKSGESGGSPGEASILDELKTDLQGEARGKDEAQGDLAEEKVGKEDTTAASQEDTGKKEETKPEPNEVREKEEAMLASEKQKVDEKETNLESKEKSDVNDKAKPEPKEDAGAEVTVNEAETESQEEADVKDQAKPELPEVDGKETGSDTKELVEPESPTEEQEQGKENESEERAAVIPSSPEEWPESPTDEGPSLSPDGLAPESTGETSPSASESSPSEVPGSPTEPQPSEKKKDRAPERRVSAPSRPRGPRAQNRKAIMDKFGGAASGPTALFRNTKAAGAAIGGVKNMLLEWCRAMTRNYEHVDIQNFSSSWSSGMAFCALIHKFFPEAFDYAELDPAKRRHNFTLAFSTAEKLADCAQLLEVDDMVRLAVPDSKCVYTYIQELYRSLVQKGLVKTKKK
ncbi:smoothelin-like protein 1 isoform X1 [Mus musculus]|uniref:Smoothelin-like protein 1 n=1 Tax=Mus musculus TaxID=10090 RepID=SMTL1_MOUSE|nr:smoothelin-like protein 1 [Mus musculus]XP_006500172.1 smoothelin-like protein 1 isoform X1 [Mus musculus]Q99LM3.1 RecName: Full=Smoothelin-like protein 1; AltName: Full=Calponin homology-associated smooth muscle protein; Short=CHASM [Mus musculus]AAH02317.1 Smoothelin-like 1 [Mus musculus]EDL27304.1 smoothelin-like 1 [Mus musculus]|eukprot:NP_077192.1 smoothelin-like protein 1 [Mus musculus]